MLERSNFFKHCDRKEIINFWFIAFAWNQQKNFMSWVVKGDSINRVIYSLRSLIFTLRLVFYNYNNYEKFAEMLPFAIRIIQKIHHDVNIDAL